MVSKFTKIVNRARAAVLSRSLQARCAYSMVLSPRSEIHGIHQLLARGQHISDIIRISPMASRRSGKNPTIADPLLIHVHDITHDWVPANWMEAVRGVAMPCSKQPRDLVRISRMGAVRYTGVLT